MKSLFIYFFLVFLILAISACSHNGLPSLPEETISGFLPEPDVPVFPLVLEDGSTYYVDDNSGSDENPGTSAEPWVTLQHAADVAKPGDTIIVRPGNYGRLVIKTGGSPGQYITFRGEAKPVTSHIDMVASFNPHNPVHQEANPEENAVVAGITIAPVWNAIEPVSNVQIKNFEITQIEKGQRSGISLQFAEDIQIIDNFIHDINPVPYNDCGINGSSGPDRMNKRVLVRGNTLFHVMGIGIIAMGESWLVEGNEISHGIDIRTDVSPSDEDNFWISGDTDATRFFGTGHVIRNNYIYDYILTENYGSPHIDAFQTFSVYPETQNASRILINHNYVENMGGQIFIIADQSEKGGGDDVVNNITLRDNILNGSGAVNVMIGRNSNYITVKNNIITRSGLSSINISGNSDHIRVLNNIFYMNYEDDPDSRRGQMLTDETCFDGSIWDYNLHYPDFSWPHKPAEGSPFAKHDIYGEDPKFINQGNPLGSDGIPFTSDDGFRLSLDSPAKGTGYNGEDMGPHW